MLRMTDAVLCVIDLQTGLLPRIAGADEITEKSIKLARFARTLEIPIILTEQYPKGLGRTIESIAAELDGVTPFEKVAFGCFGAQEFPEAVEKTGRKQILVVGIEAHVCVMQTVLVGIELGYDLYVARDAIGSRCPDDCRAGIDRMAASGATLVTVEMAMFEILRAAGTPEFKKVLPLIK